MVNSRITGKKIRLNNVLFIFFFAILAFYLGLVELIFLVSASPEEISSCAILNSAGQTYEQIANIVPNNSATPCINITANNVTFNGQGFWIANSTFTNTGIYASGRLNLTVQNANISLNRTNSNANGIEFVATNSSIIKDSTFNSNYRGINLNSNSNNNTLQNITVNNNSQSGIYLPNAKNNLFDNITLNSNSYAFEFAGPSFNSLASNNVIKNFNANSNNYGVYFEMTLNYNNSFINGVINGSKNDAIYFFSSIDINTVKNISFINVNVTNTNLSHYDLKISQYDENDFYLESFNLVDTLLNNYSIIKNGNPSNFYVAYLTVEDTRYGEVKFLSPVNGTGTNLTADILILNNSVTVRSDVNPGLNRSANVTLRGLRTNLGDPTMLRDGSACASGICYNFTSLNAGTVVFNVSYWTNYSVWDITPPNVTVASPLAQTYSTSTYLVNLTLHEGGACQYSLNNGVTNKTLTADALNKTFNTTETGVSNGDYVLRAFCNDTVGNNNYTRNVSFSISVSSGSSGGSSGGGGGGGGGVASQTYTLSTQHLNEGYSNSLAVNDKLKFIIDLLNYTLTVNSFNATTAKITLQSSTIYLSKDVAMRINVNGDNNEDIVLIYQGINSAKAKLFIQNLLSAPPSIFNESSQNATSEGNDSTSDESSRKINKALIYNILFVVLAIAGLIGLRVAIYKWNT